MAASLTSVGKNATFAIICQTQWDQKTVDDNLAGQTAGRAKGGLADAWGWVSDISSFFSGISCGSIAANVTYLSGAAASFATQTVTFSGNLTANDTLTIAGVTITFVSGTPSGSQVKIGASQAITMTNLITFINGAGSSNNLIGVCTAAQTSTNVITLTSIFPGIVGNMITLAKVSTNLAVGGATFAGGALSTYSPSLSVGL